MEEPINLTWSQQLAASWSITWPALLAPWVFVLIIAIIGSGMDWVQAQPTFGWILSALFFLSAQGVLGFRLVRKNYRSFWIGVLRDGQPRARELKLDEALRVWFQLIWPQALFLLAIYILFGRGSNLGADTVRSLNSTSQLVRILIVGPIAIRCAIYAKYPGFRLQAYRRNRWSDPRPAEPAQVSEG